MVYISHRKEEILMSRYRIEKVSQKWVESVKEKILAHNPNIQNKQPVSLYFRLEIERGIFQISD